MRKIMKIFNKIKQKKIKNPLKNCLSHIFVPYFVYTSWKNISKRSTAEIVDAQNY